MVDQVGVESICEIWKITDVRPENKKRVHFVIIVDSVSPTYLVGLFAVTISE